ncbi:PxKF domain-containing protein [Paenibacillus sp. OV219]|uniref:PxKF domain-containing protein n=1 Tax=Paenibacillus sp. OV219 TaxID=1884377 RepID=UPI0008AE619D|nr:PxKF domain-containing protein [Paenibacillus sp. OV219]SEO75243.1 Calcineurin-like phosphoesterase [Paenibacillus sp. OV219]
MMKTGKKYLASLVSMTLMLSILPFAQVVTVSASPVTPTIAADWIFDQAHSTEDNGALKIMDQSGNNNDLHMQFFVDDKIKANPATLSSSATNTKGVNVTAGTYGSFTTNTMPGTTDAAGSFNFQPVNARTASATSNGNVVRTGVDFITALDAPINQNQFKNGYTMEFIYKLDTNYSKSTSNSSPYRDKWMGIMGRLGNSSGKDNMSDDGTYGSSEYPMLSKNEPFSGTMNVSVSDIREVQYGVANADNNYYPTTKTQAWSNPMEKGQWHNIVITSDNSSVRVIVDGVDAYRGYYGADGAGMKGMFADPNDGRFYIGAAYWIDPLTGGVISDAQQDIDAMLRGELQHIRISDGALDPSQWLIPNPLTTLNPVAGTPGSHAVPGNNDPYSLVNPTANNDYDYNVVFIPDTQYNTQSSNFIVNDSMQWLVDHKDSAKVKAIVSLGDITQSNDPDEYVRTHESYDRLANAGIPTLISEGNHDYGGNPPADLFKASYGPTSPWNALVNPGGVQNVIYSPSGQSSYTFFNAGSYKYLAVSLGWFATPNQNANEGTWLQDVLTANPNIPTIIETHDMCTSNNGVATLSTAGTSIWNITKDFDQVFMMIGGHYTGAATAVLQNTNGKDVKLVLADYQSANGSGFGYLRFAEFDELNNVIHMRTFSPYAASLTDAEKGNVYPNYLEDDEVSPLASVYGKFVNTEDWAFNFNDRFPVAVKSVAFATNSISKHIGETYQLAPTVLPITAKDKSLIYSSSASSVATVSDTGLVTAVAPGTATITATTVDGKLTSTFTVIVKYNFNGFFQPIDMGVTAVNTVKAGSAVPVKFSLNGDMGLDIFATGYPKVVDAELGPNVNYDEVESVGAATNSGLTYDNVTKTYTYVWKTDKSWTATDKRLVIKLKDGTTCTANFVFK